MSTPLQHLIKPVFENDYFIAVDKPSMWLSVPSRMGDKETRPVLGVVLQNEYYKNQRKIYPIHRLDLEVSGIILYAFTAEAHRDSQQWFEEKSVQKIYQAKTDNPQNQQLSPQQEFLWESKILRGKKRAYDHDLGKQALTKAKLLGIELPLQWQLEPLTGRSHQLRYELAKQGFPIVGDTLYGSKTPYSLGIALRAVRLSFPENIQKKWSLPETLSASSLFS